MLGCFMIASTSLSHTLLVMSRNTVVIRGHFLTMWTFLNKLLSKFCYIRAWLLESQLTLIHE